MKKILVIGFGLLAYCQSNYAQVNLDNRIEEKIDSLMAKMTLEEKVGQMNQYNGFWNVTGPIPEDGDASNKYEHLKNGWVGSMLREQTKFVKYKR